MSDRDLLGARDDVFMIVDPDELKRAQRAELGPYFAKLVDPKTPLPPKLTIGTMLHYFE